MAELKRINRIEARLRKYAMLYLADLVDDAAVCEGQPLTLEEFSELLRS